MSVDDDPVGRLRHSTVRRRGEVVVRGAGPWTPSVHDLLRHLAAVGFAGAPRVVGSGSDPDGRETLGFVEGEVQHPGQPTVEAAAAVGRLLHELHRATASYRPPPDAAWQASYLEGIGDGPAVIGHRDVAPWNVVTRDGLPVALIDWDLAGPIDPVVEVAVAAWTNANLYSDDVPERERLPPVDVRARQLRAIAEEYGLPARARHGLVDLIVQVVVHCCSSTAHEAGVTPQTGRSEALWALAWMSHSASWILRNRRPLDNALA